jgi:hypothetical protein
MGGSLPLVAARHFLWGRRDRARELLWKDRPGFQPRTHQRNRIELVELERADGAGLAAPATACLGVLEPGSALAAFARLLGLGVTELGGGELALLLERALRHRWGLLAGSADRLGSLPADRLRTIDAFVRGGGTLFVYGVRPGTDLRHLSRHLNLEPVHAAPLPTPSGALLFQGAVGDFAGLLAGVRMETSEQGSRLRGAARPLAVSLVGREAHPSLVELTSGQGRVVLSSFAGELLGDLAGSFGPELSPVLLPPAMALKRAFGAAAWHPPALLANFSIDDPALREGLLGLPYSEVARIAQEHEFHVTVATIPAELGLAQRDVLAQLGQQRQLVSACYHGWNHDGYEFYRSTGSRLRYRVRSLPEQREALRLAAEQGRRFAEQTGYELDRVMVFPHGIGPGAILPDLHRLGFIASCNLDNRYPLETEVPGDPHLGLRPADTAWAGFPLLWRRSVTDTSYLMDLFLGRPAMTMRHREQLGRKMQPFVERAEEIRRVGRGTVVWRGLDEVARHAYWQRLDPQLGWQLLMTTNEACLHNPDPGPRTFTVWRPDLPVGSRFEGTNREAAEGLRVTVPPGAKTTIRLLRGKQPPELPTRHTCSLP